MENVHCDTVTWTKKPTKANTPSEPVVKKVFDSNSKKLDNTDGAPPILQTVGIDLRLAIQKARQAKKWTQKDLATQINEKQTVINDYESGKIVPSMQIILKMERALGVKLPRPAKIAKNDD